MVFVAPVISNLKEVSQAHRKAVACEFNLLALDSADRHLEIAPGFSNLESFAQSSSKFIQSLIICHLTSNFLSYFTVPRL